ncbi:cytochrome P450 [Burkholderia cenocepacia]|uniref:cytochrome P450 n=1 Tax=Burkholderia cenocepacia TaxID=95486 RepID=UPI0028B9E328|nr:cytochrome P450 [Burkholderia cenocepacia]MDT6997621.1 cytochrome P450 [Burkholderia cenocepacia]
MSMSYATGDFLQDPYLPWADPAFRNNPYPWYERLQREAPVYRISEHEFVVSKYADYVEFAKHPAMSMEEPDWVKPHPWHVFKDSVLFYDPPRQTLLRRHFNKWFTPKMVAEWAKHTKELVSDALDNIARDGVVEAHHNICVVPTHVTMCRVFDIPEDDIEGVVENGLRIVMAQSPASTKAQLDDAVVGFKYLFDRCNSFVTEKRRNPGNGLADALIEAQARGELTEAEVVQAMVNFFFSGAPNPAYVLASALEHFTREPGLFDLYKTVPESRQAMINEFLRLYPPELSFTRYNKTEVTIGGTVIPADSVIRFMTAAVNRDPDVFAEPNKFDHTRSMRESQMLSFGIGTHGCAGQLISRVEIEVILTAIAERYSRVELAGSPTVQHDDRIRNYLTLPLRLS